MVTLVGVEIALRDDMKRTELTVTMTAVVALTPNESVTMAQYEVVDVSAGVV